MIYAIHCMILKLKSGIIKVSLFISNLELFSLFEPLLNVGHIKNLYKYEIQYDICIAMFFFNFSNNNVDYNFNINTGEEFLNFYSIVSSFFV